MRKMPFYKFDADAWLLGKIQSCDHRTKGIFTDLTALAWRENNVVRRDKFLANKLKVTSSELDSTLSDLEELEIVHEKDGILSIKFIQEQLDEREEYLERCRAGGKKSANIRKSTSTKQKAESRYLKEKSLGEKENFSENGEPLENQSGNGAPSDQTPPKSDDGFDQPLPSGTSGQSGNGAPSPATSQSRNLPEDRRALDIAGKLLAIYPKRGNQNYAVRAAKQAVCRLFDGGMDYDGIETKLMAAVRTYSTEVASWRQEDRRYAWSMEMFFADAHYNDDPATWKRYPDQAASPQETPQYGVLNGRRYERSFA